MKILFIHNQYQQPGGEDVAVSLESRLLQQKGHEVRTILFENRNPSGTLDKIRLGVRSIYNRRSREEVTREIKAFKPDIIHVHNLFFDASPSVLFAAATLKVPVVLTLHNYRLICANALLLRDGKPCELCVNKTFPLSGIRYRCYRNSMTETALVTAITSTHKTMGTWQHKLEKFIVLTEFAKSRFLNSSLKVSDSKLIVKPNFLPDPGAGEHVREDFFLFVGRLSAEKGINILVDAFKKPSASKLVVVGDGPERKSAEAEFSDTERVTFKGDLNKEEVLRLMKRCKALIFPSVWYEGLPFVIIEALATGTPIIASRLGSMVELVTDGYNGFHFEPANSQDLHIKIELFLQLSEKDRAQLYVNARDTYLNKYHPDTHYQAILSVYEKVIEKSIPDV